MGGFPATRTPPRPQTSLLAWPDIRAHNSGRQTPTAETSENQIPRIYQCRSGWAAFFLNEGEAPELRFFLIPVSLRNVPFFKHVFLGSESQRTKHRGKKRRFKSQVYCGAKLLSSKERERKRDPYYRAIGSKAVQQSLFSPLLSHPQAGCTWGGETRREERTGLKLLQEKSGSRDVRLGYSHPPTLQK